MGSVVIDLRQAQFAQPEVVLNANAVMGEVKVIVDAATTVVVEGTGVMGEYSESAARVPCAARAGGPVLRVRGFALMGSVHVQRKGPPGEASARLSGGWGTVVGPRNLVWRTQSLSSAIPAKLGYVAKRKSTAARECGVDDEGP